MNLIRTGTGFSRPILFLIPFLFCCALIWSGCECETFDPNACDGCNDPERVCVEGFCVCDTNTHYTDWQGLCLKKGSHTYKNLDESEQCFSRQILVDSLGTGWGGISEYELFFQDDSIANDGDKWFVLEYYFLPDGDSLVMFSNFQTKTIQGQRCRGFLYGKHKNNNLHIKLIWKQEFSHQHMDSCQFVLYRDQ